MRGSVNQKPPRVYVVTLSDGTVIVCPYVRWPAADFYTDCVKPREETA